MLEIATEQHMRTIECAIERELVVVSLIQVCFIATHNQPNIHATVFRANAVIDP